MRMGDDRYAACVAAIDALAASAGGPEDVQRCIGVVVPALREATGSDQIGPKVAGLLRAGQIDSAKKVLEAAGGRAAPVARPCPGCGGRTSWSGAAGCPDCGYKPKPRTLKVVLMGIAIGAFLAAMWGAFGHLIFPGLIGLSEPFVCGSGERAEMRSHDISLPDGRIQTNYQLYCVGGGGEQPVEMGLLLVVQIGIWLVPGIILGLPLAFALDRRVQKLRGNR
jgi:hypothetical protein